MSLHKSHFPLFKCFYLCILIVLIICLGNVLCCFGGQKSMTVTLNCEVCLLRLKSDHHIWSQAQGWEAMNMALLATLNVLLWILCLPSLSLGSPSECAPYCNASPSSVLTFSDSFCFGVFVSKDNIELGLGFCSCFILFSVKKKINGWVKPIYIYRYDCSAQS